MPEKGREDEDKERKKGNASFKFLEKISFVFYFMRTIYLFIYEDMLGLKDTHSGMHLLSEREHNFIHKRKRLHFWSDFHLGAPPVK